MATHEAQLRGRLGRVRRRWRLTAAFRGLLLVATEALGVFLVILLADVIYDFSGSVLLGLWAVGGAVVAVLFARHVLHPLLRGIPDERIALLIEERAEQAEGAVISAVECSRQKRSGLYNFLVNFLVDDAVARIDRTPLRVVSNLRRLRKHVLIGLVLLAAFVATTLTFPKWRGRGHGVLIPWVRIAEEKEQDRIAQAEKAALEARLYAKMSFEVSPGDARLLRGRGIRVLVKLSRPPPETPQLLCRAASGGGAGDWEVLPMSEVQALNSYSYDLTDVNEDMMYLVAAARQQSAAYKIEVYDRLAIKGIELTYRYPAYLELPPETNFGPNGDISVPSETKVDLRVVANNQLKSGRIVFDEKKTTPLKLGAKAADGASTSFPVTADATYSVTVTDVYGDTVSSPGGDGFFYVKAVPDEPPTVELAAPKVDMSVHPLCEVTFRAKVTDDFGIKDAVVKGNVHRGEKATPLKMAMKVSEEGTGRTKNVKDGTAEYTWQLESAKPQVKPGDMVFYYLEAGDRKGQIVKTDVFFIKLWPLEVAGTWPSSIAPPDLPHETFNDPMDLMLFLAAAWALEQERGLIPTGEFNAKSEKIAQRMEVGDPPDFSTFWGHGGAPEGGGPNRGLILAAATTHVEAAHGLLKYKHEPGKAADRMRIALAMVETLGSDKRLLALELNPEPIHTGQPSSGHADDPVMEQIAFRIPSVMSDSITAFQQPDNPPRLLPPDYRRALRIKQRQGFRVKQLRVAGEIYATEEQLIEMAREQVGHIQLREAIDDNTPNDPAQSAGGGEEVRVDKRAIPYKKLVGADDRRGQVARAPGQTLSVPKVDRIKNPLKYDKIRDNRRRGGSNPYLTQAPGGGGGEQDDEDQDRPERMDEDALRQMRARIMARRPPQGGGGGGGDGEPMPMGMQQPGGMSQQQQSSTPGSRALMRQMAAWQGQLARATGQVARDVARSMEPGDSMSRQAVGGLRDASTEMRKAAQSFRRGDVRGGIAQARRAQGMLRTAMHRLQASQYESLEQAVAAAQDGAAALAANQYRIGQGTGQITRRVSEMTGEPGKRQPGQAQPGQAQPGQAQPGQGQPGQAQPGQAQPGQAQPGQAQPGQGQPGQAQPGKGQPGKAQPGQAQPGQAQPGQAQPGQAQPGKGQPGQAQPGKGQPGQTQPGKGQPGTGTAQAPSRQAVEKAVARDPRIGPQLQGLAAQQGRLAQDLVSFMSYVGDLKKWASEAAKARVAGSLRDVNKDLRREGTPQKMVDAAIGLAGKDLQAAVKAQKEVEKSLERMLAGVQEAGEILAGSPTGILRRAARDARDVGRGVAAIASRGGQGGRGQPGRAQPGQAQPGQAQPGQGQPGQAQPGQAQPGQGQPGQARPGEAQPATGEPGKGEPGKGRPEADLAQLLAGQKGQLPGEPSARGTPSMSGGGVGSNQDIGELWLKTRRLAKTLQREQLAEEQVIRFMRRRSADIETFRKMFDRARRAEAMKFAEVALGVGKNLEEALKEALSAKRLHAEQREECPPKYREFVNAYFEALSKAAGSDMK